MIGNKDVGKDMIISLKVLGFKRYQTLKIEDPDHMSLTKLARYYFLLNEEHDPDKMESKGEQKMEYLFYSRAEQGVLNPFVPLSQLMIADEDQLLIIPSNLKFHSNPFEHERRKQT